MITEDYVSFEVAKILKGKGFEGYVSAYYHIWDNDSKVYSIQEFNHSAAPHLYIPAPTLQMVIKWFREIHNIDICVCRELDEYGKCFNGYIAVVYKNNSYKITIREAMEDLKFEEASNKAIEYGLTLI